mmetsp:Transcript_114666/g.244636  ORF Transcript_114666/g.244636 Transcript_114666/m.244636 type:complete len:122 (+) Transcript_114666:3-368(+)
MRGEALTAVFAAFWAAEPASQDEVIAFLRRHELDYEGGGSRPGSSAIALYLEACRPAQLRAMQAAGVKLEPESCVFTQAALAQSPQQRVSWMPGGGKDEADDIPDAPRQSCRVGRTGRDTR